MGKVYAGSKSLKWWLYSNGNHEVEEAHGHYYLILMAEVDVTFLTLVVTPINPDLDVLQEQRCDLLRVLRKR
jgi:hypothetical protein